jgi:hypothetical protein
MSDFNFPPQRSVHAYFGGRWEERERERGGGGRERGREGKGRREDEGV